MTPALALDFDGVLCDGRPEYFEASCRAYGHVWSPLTLSRRGVRTAFDRLRPVIMSGWEMPVLLRAIVTGVRERTMLAEWPAVRDALLAALPVPRDAAVSLIRTALDDVRRDWIRVAPDAWIEAHRPYVTLAVLRRVLSQTPRAAVVTTKEGEFARRILDHWGVKVADVAGKERGEHKCDNLVELLGAAPPAVGALAFVEDRLETLDCVVRCSAREPRLASVRLYLASWGYTTPAARATARRHPRIRLLALSAFARGPAAWS
ncbi:MAG: HAD family hydrolase [Candidatus Rokubacteria bacterium]|nr:HAD family hydrolase [Candidatus Rokubacteria bacterium]